VRLAAAAAFPAVSARLEGRTSYPYLDVKGLATIGVGCLVEPMAAFLALPLAGPGGPLDDAAKAQDWRSLHARAPGLLASAYACSTVGRLDGPAVDALTTARAQAAETVLRAACPGWDYLPATVQLATLLLAWAVGAVGVVHGFPRYWAALCAGDYATCLAEAHLDEAGLPGLVPRNALIAQLLRAAVAGGDLDGLPVSVWP
jgi:hypothetical protein